MIVTGNDYWETKPTQIKFDSDDDTASDTYCMSSTQLNIMVLLILESELKLVGDTFGECEL